MPAVNTKARARIAAIVFMAAPLCLVVLLLPEQGKEIRDHHHVLVLFHA
jgi:hypothetical protein